MTPQEHLAAAEKCLADATTAGAPSAQLGLLHAQLAVLKLNARALRPLPDVVQSAGSMQRAAKGLT